jgi:pimeloyl-ACP methyl ester carboxylesterase
MHRRPGTPNFYAVEDLRPPNVLLMMMEGRAPLEYAAMLAATPWLRRLPEGDGHPVLVIPGLGANDVTTLPLRRFLDDLGYVTHPWGQGFNFGPRHGVLQRANAHVQALFERHAQAVSIIGWSLGGIYARELAKELPSHVRGVITLGTPFTGHPRATNAWRFYELVSGTSADDPRRIEALRDAPPVPTSSIFSRSDGIVAWRCSINAPGPMVENIEIAASHVGMGMNPLALFAVADRLAQPAGQWQPFQAAGARRWFYRIHPGMPHAAAA